MRALNTVLRYYWWRQAMLVETNLGWLTPNEKVGSVQEIVQNTSNHANGRSQLLASLATCRFPEAERRRVLQELRLAGEHVWMYPAVEVTDYPGCAALMLDEAIGRRARELPGFPGNRGQ